MTKNGKGTKTRKIIRDPDGPFNLAIDRKPETRYLHMQTQFVHIGFDGRRTGDETYLLPLSCVPAELSGESLDRYTCKEFGLRKNGGPIVSIPALELWEYRFDPVSGGSGHGPVFGIPHDRFEALTDSQGNDLPPEIRYAVYNNFIDFHALNDVFPRPMKSGKGIQDLKFVGDRIVHAAAFTEAPVSLGTTIRQGSVFRNGEITLELKGIGIVDGAACALIGYDSGECTLKMIIRISDKAEAVTEGGSQYKGDLYLDLETGWVRKATLDEFVVTRTSGSGIPDTINSYTVRHLLLRSISREEFGRNLGEL